MPPTETDTDIGIGIDTDTDFDVLVVGSCNIDLAAYTDRMPKPGETVTGNGFAMANGGKGGNQAAMVGRLGGKVAMMARVGADHFGRIYKEQLQNYGVNVDTLLETPDVHTGVATILVLESSGENQIVLSGGANDLLSVEDLDKYMAPLVSRCKIVVVQLEVKREITLHALKLAKKYGAITLLNTAPAFPDLDPEFFANTDVICFNETEGEILTGVRLDQHIETSTTMLMMNKILDLGCKAAVFTQGKNGATLMYSSNREMQYHMCTSHPVKKVVDTTGAGDCFIGCMAYFMAKNTTEKGLPIDKVLKPAIIQMSTNIATLSVQKPGAQTSYPAFDEIPASYLATNCD